MTEPAELRVVGAGLPRTGTSSLQRMLEQLLNGPCYHMRELKARIDTDLPGWWKAFDGDIEGLRNVFDGWVAAVDWPASILWRELAELYPDALVVLSHRGSSATWWASADTTVWEYMRQVRDGTPEPSEGFHQRLRKRAGFDEDLAEPAARARYDQHFDEVVATIPGDRLLVWQPGDGWEPLCERLGLPVPDEPPAHANAKAEFRDRLL